MISSSRNRFAAYRDEQRRKRARRGSERTVVSFHGTERSLKRQRTFWQLFRSFLGELRPYRRSIDRKSTRLNSSHRT